MSSLPTFPVGQTALHVPAIGLGTAPLGTFFANITEAQAVDTVQYALQNGVTLIDTAPWYDAHLVETRVGSALRGVPREGYVLATKVGRRFDAGGQPYLDFTRDGVLRSIEGSLQRLGVDAFDILYLHAPEGDQHYRTAVTEAYPLLAEMRQQGQIKAIGVGENFWEPLVDWARDAQCDCFLLAGRYTLLEQGALTALDAFHAQGISIFGAGIYNSGILAKGSTAGGWYQYADAPAAVIAKVRQIEVLCQRHDVSLQAAAVQFVKVHPAMTTLVIGAESPQQLQQSIEAYHAPISENFWQDLREAGLIDPQAPLPTT